MDTMKLLLAIVLPVLFVLTTKAVAHAQTTVNVTTNTGGNTINGSSASTTTSHSTVTINGKTFEANGDESVDWTSEDGKSHVQINNNSVKGASTSTPTLTPTPMVTGESTLPPTGGPSPTAEGTPTASPTPTVHPKAMSFDDFISKYFSWFTKLFK